ERLKQEFAGGGGGAALPDLDGEGLLASTLTTGPDRSGPRRLLRSRYRVDVLQPPFGEQGGIHPRSLDVLPRLRAARLLLQAIALDDPFPALRVHVLKSSASDDRAPLTACGVGLAIRAARRGGEPVTVEQRADRSELQVHGQQWSMRRRGGIGVAIHLEA